LIDRLKIGPYSPK